MASTIDTFLHSSQLNNLVGWGVVLLLALVSGESLLDGDIIWLGFTMLVLSVLLLPTLYERDRSIHIPWEFLILASLPITASALDVMIFQHRSFLYLSFASLALIIAVELHMYTDIKMTHWFAVLFVCLTTIAIEGSWAVSRWYADSLLGTSLLPPHDVLMLDFVAVTAVGIGAGVFFDIYFHHHGRGELA